MYTTVQPRHCFDRRDGVCGTVGRWQPGRPLLRVGSLLFFGFVICLFPLNWSPQYFKLPEQNFRSRSFQPHFPFDAVRSSDSFVTPTLESGLTCATHTHTHTHTLAWTCKKQGSYGSYSGPSLTIVTQLGKTKRVRKHQLFCCSLYYLKFIIILH